jgi:hypothetical protein
MAREKFTPGEWRYLSCECLITIGQNILVLITYECQQCGNTNLRFIHTLEHLEDKRQIRVGIECAGDLIEDYELPRLAENETKRKERWRREKYRTPGRCVTTIDNLIERGKL